MNDRKLLIQKIVKRRNAVKELETMLFMDLLEMQAMEEDERFMNDIVTQNRRRII